MKKNNTKSNYIKFIFSEEFKVKVENPTEKYLKNIFNKKYFNYIKRLENKITENN